MVPDNIHNKQAFIGLDIERYLQAAISQVAASFSGIFVLSWLAMISPLFGQSSSGVLEDPLIPASPWKPSASLAVKEAFDENVFLQGVASNGFHHSAVTTVLPTVGISFNPAQAFHANLSYGPELNFYHSASSEDFTLHRVLLGIDGSASQTRWELSENFVAIDGSELGPSFFGLGGPPAGGGPQIRDRRAALIERGQARLIQTFDPWFIRPVLTGYLHDFKTIQLTTAGYQNYADRNEWTAGADVGRKMTEEFSLTLGYRYGRQTQATLLDFPEHYDNSYHRALVGLEGKPLNWLCLSISAGPEFRRYGPAVARGFTDRNQNYPFVDATVTVMPVKAQVFTVSARSFEQPGFSGRSTYLDSTFEAAWRHKFGEKLTLGLGLRAYHTDFLKPVERNDWIVTPSIVASYGFNHHFSSELSYLFDDAFSLIPGTPGREYIRQLVAVGFKYSL